MPNILLIEDNPGDALLIQETLKDASSLVRRYRIRHVERVSDAVAILSQQHDIDIVLSDITLPDARGLETLRMISNAADGLPVLFMTGTNDEALAVTALHQGAQDYLVKGRTSGDALARALQYAIERNKTQNQMNEIRARAESDRQRVRLLGQQKRELIELNKSKDEFISIASHQLRTPATAVKQYLGMLVEGYFGDVDAIQMEALQTAYDSNERQLDVINDLLRTARIDSLKMRLKLEAVDITALVQDVVRKYKPTTDLRRQTVSFEPQHRHEACVDRAEFSLVLENIFENASKYTPPGKTIAIELEERRRKLVVRIIDQGVGIPEAHQQKIFDKFTRVDNELSDTVSGTGLGLYWAKKILKLHRGSIAVRSVPGEGSTFILQVPLQPTA